MKYLDITQLSKLDREDFLKIKPYPYYNHEGVLTEEGFQDLLANMPPIELFKHNFGYERRAGQAPHDRYSLEYEPGMPVPQAWQDFIAEMRSDAYRDQIARLLGAKKVEFRFHWHYTPSGCDVSPHCDAAREHGSHLFYFNSAKDWDPAWGGATLVLDTEDGGRWWRRIDNPNIPECSDVTLKVTMNSDRLIGVGAAISIRAFNAPVGNKGAFTNEYLYLTTTENPVTGVLDNYVEELTIPCYSRETTFIVLFLRLMGGTEGKVSFQDIELVVKE